MYVLTSNHYHEWTCIAIHGIRKKPLVLWKSRFKCIAMTSLSLNECVFNVLMFALCYCYVWLRNPNLAMCVQMMRMLTFIIKMSNDMLYTLTINMVTNEIHWWFFCYLRTFLLLFSTRSDWTFLISYNKVYYDQPPLIHVLS